MTLVFPLAGYTLANQLLNSRILFISGENKPLSIYSFIVQHLLMIIQRYFISVPKLLKFLLELPLM